MILGDEGERARMPIKRSFGKDSKALSPVISTIIIVAVAIGMSIAVAYWTLGLGTAFTRYGKIEYKSWYTHIDTEGKYFLVKIEIKNTGSAALSLDRVFVNGKPADAYDVIVGQQTTPTVLINWTKTTLEPGQESTVMISLRKGLGSKWVSGMMVEVNIRTTDGGEYPKVVILP